MFRNVGLFFQKLAVAVVTAALIVAGVFTGTYRKDTKKAYLARVDGVDFLKTDIASAAAQPEIYGIIKDHLEGPLPEGKTAKKAIVIGYDGCRLDALSLINDEHESAVRALADGGGTVCTCYCGGRPYPQMNTQATSTAPGWCTMLTGVWARELGVKDNGQPKSMEKRTLLTSAVEDGVIGSAAFYVSWNGHFVDDDGTYSTEKRYIEEKGLNVTLSDAGGDDGTLENVLADLAREDCSDFIFSIFEYTDHVGHDTGFCPNNPDYVQAFYDAEAAGCAVLGAIRARPAYETEDWLILISSDHGGFDSFHGFCTLQERMTFIAVNKDI